MNTIKTVKLLLVLCVIVTLVSHITKDTPAAVKLDKTEVVIESGETVELSLLGADKKIKWSSSDREIANVNSKGIVTAKKAGKAVITAKHRNKKYKCQLVVKNKTSKMEVHFIDVGQGDATLIKCGGENMLIDAGDNSKGTLVQNYLKKQGVDTLDYVICTHSDSDHAGGMDVILTKFNCKTVLYPDTDCNTATWRDVRSAMEYKGYKRTAPLSGKEYTLGQASFTILSQDGAYESDNDNSIVIMMTHKDVKFLFTGDIEYEAQEGLVKTDLKADVYKVSHHGSKTGTTEEFLDAISPTYAVISCGEDNSYGHPHAGPLTFLRSRGIKTYRTDEQGSIIALSDGNTVTFNCSPSNSWIAGESQSAADNINNSKSGKYVINKNTKKIHDLNCISVLHISKKNRFDFDGKMQDLINEGYSPCKVCKP